MTPIKLLLAAVLTAATAASAAAQSPSPQAAPIYPRPDRQIAWGLTPVGAGLARLGELIQGLGTRHVWTIHRDRYRRIKQTVPVGYYLISAAPVAARATP
jgi:hypothetical protein